MERGHSHGIKSHVFCGFGAGKNSTLATTRQALRYSPWATGHRHSRAQRSNYFIPERATKGSFREELSYIHSNLNRWFLFYLWKISFQGSVSYSGHEEMFEIPRRCEYLEGSLILSHLRLWTPSTSHFFNVVVCWCWLTFATMRFVFKEKKIFARQSLHKLLFKRHIQIEHNFY